MLGVERCHQEGQWVEEMPYEVMGIEIHGNSLITEAPRKGREAAILQVHVHIQARVRKDHTMYMYVC